MEYNPIDSNTDYLKTLKQPFLISNNAGQCSEGNTYGDFYWTYNWVTEFDNGTILYDEYPLIYRETQYGNSQKLTIDLRDDPGFKYIGNMTVSLYSNLPKNLTRL